MGEIMENEANKTNESNEKNELFNVYYIDPITKGWNRTYFDNKASELIKNSPSGTYSFVTCDISGFALINDLFGIETGNAVLRHLQKVFEKYTSDYDLVSRHTNDIFNLLINNSTRTIKEKANWAPLFEVLADIRNVPELKIMQESNMNYLNIKIGVYEIDNPTEDIILIRDKANIAKKSKHVKQTSPHITIGFYSDYELKEKEKEEYISRQMTLGLANGEFETWLQPKLNLSNGCVTGAEALVRWNDPKVGLVPPMEFIPVMEKSGFVKKVDFFIFEECCKILRKWIDSGKNPIRISSNFSRLHLNNDHFVEDLLEITSKYNVSPCYFEIELTETIVFEDLKNFVNVNKSLRNAGFLFAIDDFGSGYSSLNMLSELDVDIIKLDRSFFGDEYFPNQNRQNVIESMVHLGKELGCEIIIEGVENEAQLEFVCRIGCNMAQGYVTSKPIPINEFEEKYIHNDFCKESIKELANYLASKRESDRLLLANFNSVATHKALSDIGRYVCYYDIKTESLALSESYARRYGLPLILRDFIKGNDASFKHIFNNSSERRKAYLNFFKNIGDAKEDTGEGEFQLYATDEIYYWERILWTRIFDDDGNASHAIIVIDDTTERHVHELEERYSSVLIADALKRAETANAVKREFLTRMSHDLRTPLNGIVGMTEIAKKHKDNPEAVLNALEKISMSSNQLNGIVNSILDVKYFDNDSFEKTNELIDIRSLHNDLITYGQALAFEKNINFVVNPIHISKPIVYVDTIHLRQIIINIINNAVKYTPNGGKVCFNIYSKYDDDNKCLNMTYKIIDNGIGMSKEFLKDIFEPFSRERSEMQADFDGVGLGLTIAKQLIDFLNGSIDIESELNSGTSITINVSLSSANEETNSLNTINSDGKDIQGIRIMVVEDNELNREIITTILEDYNAILTIATNGKEAVDLFLNNPPGSFDVILMDLMMPVMNGYEASRKIRNSNHLDAASIPILAMTANTFAEDVNNSRAAGMNEHISKPIDIDKLISKLYYYYHR